MNKNIYYRLPMGNFPVKCAECKYLKKECTIRKFSTSTTELYIYPVSFLGVTYIPKANTKTEKYICSNGHKFEKKSKCY